MWIDKKQTWEMAHAAGGTALVDLVRFETHTCYLGERGERHDWGYGCGACPACDGLGTTFEVDPELVVPNPELTVAEGAIHPWSLGACLCST